MHNVLLTLLICFLATGWVCWMLGCQALLDLMQTEAFVLGDWGRPSWLLLRAAQPKQLDRHWWLSLPFVAHLKLSDTSQLSVIQFLNCVCLLTAHVNSVLPMQTVNEYKKLSNVKMFHRFCNLLLNLQLKGKRCNYVIRNDLIRQDSHFLHNRHLTSYEKDSQQELTALFHVYYSAQRMI